MSLFGESPPPSRQAKSSLFDEPATKSAGAGLFNDDNDAAATTTNDSPWDFPSAKKNNARKDVIKTLLPASQVPEAYVDAFDALSNGGRGVEPDQVRPLLLDGRIGSGEQAKILELVGGAVELLGRSEFNVLLALIGLAQEGDELSLDAVDERRSSMYCDHISSPPLSPTG